MAAAKSAAIKTSGNDKKNSRYIILPRNQNTYEEMFAIANGKRLPFETPLTLSRQDVETLEKQKEPFKAESNMTVYDIMDKYAVNQEKAIKIMDAQKHHPELNESTIKWRQKYIVQPV